MKPSYQYVTNRDQLLSAKKVGVSLKTPLQTLGNPAQINFNKPRFSDHEAAAFIGCSAYTLKRSRTTGTLLGVTAPTHVKLGRMVRYERATLEQWLSQFPEYQNTAQHNDGGEAV